VTNDWLKYVKKSKEAMTIMM